MDHATTHLFSRLLPSVAAIGLALGCSASQAVGADAGQVGSTGFASSAGSTSSGTGASSTSTASASSTGGGTSSPGAATSSTTAATHTSVASTSSSLAGTTSASASTGSTTSSSIASTTSSIGSSSGSGTVGPTDGGFPQTPDGGTYRSSLTVCWNDATCPRALAIGHGGMWDAVNNPYLSNGALALAYDGGMDGVKIDVRVSSDNIPVLAHSSPIQLYESVDCYNDYIENMTAAQIEQCHRFPSTTETFQRLDDVLTYLQGKLVVQLTVKRSQDYATVIQDVTAFGANDFAFFEVQIPDLQNELPTIAGWDQFYYLVDLSEVADGGTQDVPTVLAFNNPWIFMVEFGPATTLGTLVTSTLHPAGVRAFIYDDGTIVTVQTQEGYFNEGYDVVSTNSGANGVQARIAVNTARGISPP